MADLEEIARRLRADDLKIVSSAQTALIRGSLTPESGDALNPWQLITSVKAGPEPGTYVATLARIVPANAAGAAIFVDTLEPPNPNAAMGAAVP
jgi:hypothetical protein